MRTSGIPAEPRQRAGLRSQSIGETYYEPYNIIPDLKNFADGDHHSLRYPQISAAFGALRTVVGLPNPPFFPGLDGMDIFDWLGAFFGFQLDNIRNQREHLVLHLANAQMRLQPNQEDIDHGVIRRFRLELLQNYSSWCTYLGCKSSVYISDRDYPSPLHCRQELLYICLYLLIWGEAANLRFLPECICYIFHHMAMELNLIIEKNISEYPNPTPFSFGEDAFLNRVVKPIYETIKNEAERSFNGKAPHSAWRNYDDVNEYFWSQHCFKRLNWPFDFQSNFFRIKGKNNFVGKTGFVEQRSFWHLFRSFDRLWVMLILFLQASIIVAWEEKVNLRQALEIRNVQVRLLTLFITWGGLSFLQSLLDAGTQYSLISRETLWLGMRMVLKIVVSATWFCVFGFLYLRIWAQKNHDGRWSSEANRKLTNFLKAGFVFILPELITLILFVFPWIGNFIYEKNWKIFNLVTWWFHSLEFIGGALREGFMDSIKYILFWVAVLVVKFSFSYSLQIKPMIAPTKETLNLHNISYQWPEIFENTNGLVVGLSWLPVVLIYLMDLQIWYSIFSTFFGVFFVGLFSHLGEIRNMQQLRLRFQFFASAMQFNLMPEKPLLNTRGTLKSRFSDAIHQLKLWYRLSQPCKKLEKWNQVEANTFALLWNEIIATFREEDIISDKEVELLEMPPNSWGIRVTRWPCLILCNELLLALSQAKELMNSSPGSDKWLWKKICKNEYRRCAVIEAYDSIKYLLLGILKDGSEELSIVNKLFLNIDHVLEIENFTVTYKIASLPQIHTNLMSLLELINHPKKDMKKMVNVLQTLYEISIRDLPKVKRSMEQLREDGLVPDRPNSSGVGLLFENAIEVPPDDDENGPSLFYRQARRLHRILSTSSPRDSMQDIPKNVEARRRIAFFSNSLFMNIPQAPQVEKMMAFSVLTPYHDEEIVFSKEYLKTLNEDGISTLFYLQKIYDDEWRNFLERMKREGMVYENEIWTNKLWDLRLWASYRGQTLSRTVRGMMYYHKALKMLAFLDSTSNMEMLQEVQSFSSATSSSLRSLNNIEPTSGHEYNGNVIALMKYTYVVACQLYGTQKVEQDPRAEEILYLMKKNAEVLRVAYVDNAVVGRVRGKDEMEYYSVLVKYDQYLEEEVEIYRIKLPGPFKLGEGKPENQNNAIIFTRGEALQTIDMNQDNYFEEALKMRNLLEEFETYYGIRKPTILGVREHIFTGSSISSLAWFMSGQETSFVTLGQRVAANPLKVRMHYGHPDVFDRFWFLTRGGISKASRAINICEDIFAGFNCILRGGNVSHHEYIQVGKGRDVGLNQISLFEAKIASGNGEQVLSRDVYRLGHRLDFFRMLSFFYTCVGFYCNAIIVVLSIYTFLWGRLYLTLSGFEASMKDNANNNRAFKTILNQQFIIQLGLYTALPMIVESVLEKEFLAVVWDFLKLQLQLSPLFYTFSLGTRTHFFGRTILHGGAKYQGTGRGFVVQHKSFATNYRLYARSHFVKAIELGLILTIYDTFSPSAKKTFTFIDMTISSWFLVVSWIITPFLFNPSGFDWLKTVNDFDDFMNWIWYQGGVLTKADISWEAWWYEEQDHLRTTSLSAKFLEIILNLRFFFFQFGIVCQMRISNGSTGILVYLLSWIYILAVVGMYVVVLYARDKYVGNRHTLYRLVKSFAIMVILLAVAMLVKFTNFKFVDIFTSFVALIPTGWGLISIAQVLRYSFLLEKTSVVWQTVVSLARLYDLLFGVIVIAPVALLSWLPGFQSMQTRILFNEAFSMGLQSSRILTGKKHSVS